jgi:hypothetical protein
MINNILVTLVVFIVLPSLTFAQVNSSTPTQSKTTAIVDPLKSTQQVLRDKNDRQKAIVESGEKGNAADSYVEKVVGSGLKDEVYDISADLMELLQSESGGDPNKMMEILSQAQKDPEGFYNRFPAAQKEKVKKLIEKMPKQSNP